MRSAEAVLYRHAEDGEQPLVEVADALGTTLVSYSYREITRAARCLADRLTAARRHTRSRPGRMRVGVVCGDTPEFVVAELALLALRAAGCPVAPDASPETAAALLAETDALVVDAVGYARLAAWRSARVVPEGCPVLLVDTAEFAAAAAGPYRTPVGTDDWICKVLPGSGGPGPGGPGPGGSGSGGSGSGGSGSGDSGPVGGARVGVRASGVAALLDSLRAEVPPGAFARCPATVPLGALTQQFPAVYLVLLDRGCLVLPPPETTHGRLPGWLRATRPTALALTPALAGTLAAAARTARRDGRPVAPALFGTRDIPLLWCGADVPGSLQRELDTLGLPLYAGYGLPENTSLVSWNTPAPGGRRTGTVGRPLAHVRTGIGPDGELLVSGAALAEDLTPDDFRSGRARIDGWLHTGVRASIDADGFVRLLAPERAIRAPVPTEPALPGPQDADLLLYWLVRAMGPAYAVSFGGAFTDGLFQLATGARDNGAGQVTGYLPEARRAAAARARLRSAGLADWAEILEADVHTLGRTPVGEPAAVDLALLDCHPDLLVPALTALEPRMRPGTVVVATGRALPGEYLDLVRDGGGYLSVTLRVGTALEVSTRLARAPTGSRTTGPPGAVTARPEPGRPSHPASDNRAEFDA